MITKTALDMQAVATEYFVTWATGDVGDIMARHADQTRFHLHVGNRLAVGRDAVAAAFAEILAAWPGFRPEAQRLLFGDRQWTLAWTLNSHTGQGDDVRVDCLDLVEVDDQCRITAKDTFIDAVQHHVASA